MPIRCTLLQDPFNPNLKVPNPELGYPGGPFDPFGFRYAHCTALQLASGGAGRGGGS